MSVSVVDALEAIDVDHQAGDGSGAPLRARQLFLEALLQIAPIVPTRQEIRDPRAQQARAIDCILDAYGGDRPQVREKIRSMMTREARGIAAAEAQCPGCTVLARERHQGGALEVRRARKEEMVIGSHDGAEPRLVEPCPLRREADQ